MPTRYYVETLAGSARRHNLTAADCATVESARAAADRIVATLRATPYRDRGRRVAGYTGGAQLVAVTDGRASLVEVYGAV